MTTNNDDYKISIFKPTTPQAKVNRNLILSLVSIWAIAIFGFQVLLKILEKPTPEKTYVNYASVSDAVVSGNAQTEELQIFSKSLLGVLGKLYVTTEDKEFLSGVLSSTVFKLLPEGQQDSIIREINSFVKIKAETESIVSETYVSAKQNVIRILSPFVGLDNYSLEAKLLPLIINPDSMKDALPSDSKKLTEVMSKYLIHNQSVLTDFKFLGFPFHYFYTAVFLLILFVGLCWIYCIRIDRMNVKMNIAD